MYDKIRVLMRRNRQLVECGVGEELRTYIFARGMLRITLPSQWFRAPARLRVSTTAGIEQIPAVSSKEGAVIGAVPSAENSIEVITDIRHIMNNCRINEITNKLKQ
jgi:hypothetical protein